MSDFHRVLRHALHQEQLSRIYTGALFAGIGVVLVALIEGLGL